MMTRVIRKNILNIEHRKMRDSAQLLTLYEHLLPKILQGRSEYADNFSFYDSDTINICIFNNTMCLKDVLKNDLLDHLFEKHNKIRIISSSPIVFSQSDFDHLANRAFVRISYYLLSPDVLPMHPNCIGSSLMFQDRFTSEAFDEVMECLDKDLFSINNDYYGNMANEIREALRKFAPLSKNIFVSKAGEIVAYLLCVHRQPVNWYCPTLIGQVWGAKGKITHDERKCIEGYFINYLRTCEFPIYAVVDLPNSRSIRASLRVGFQPYVVTIINKSTAFKS